MTNSLEALHHCDGYAVPSNDTHKPTALSEMTTLNDTRISIPSIILFILYIQFRQICANCSYNSSRHTLHTKQLCVE